VHCGPNTGFPRVLNAIFVAKRVFDERGVSPLEGAALDSDASSALPASMTDRVVEIRRYPFAR
jgi:hypothetical protein